jgi:hypothetical protein
VRVRQEHSGSTDDTDDAEQAAVSYLERAVESAPRTMVWQYSRWFAAEDQSLKVLRGSPHYVDFLERHFPGMERREERPENVLHYLFSSHVLRVARSYARLRAEASRALQGEGGHLAFRAEQRAVRAMHLYSRDYRDWRTRLELIRASGGPRDDSSRVTLERAFPRFQDEPGRGSAQLSDEDVDVDTYYDCLIARRVCPGIWPEVHTELGGILDQLDGLPESVVLDMSPVWDRLAELVDASLGDREVCFRETSSRLVGTRLVEFRRAAEIAVRPVAPKARTAILARLPVRLSRGEGNGHGARAGAK